MSIITRIIRNTLTANSSECDCNYTDDYYGDQVCTDTTHCNYSDNYYGDQICVRG